VIPTLLALLAGANATISSDLLDQAFWGRPGSAWSGTVVVERPGKGGQDTAQVCREGTSERLDFRDGSLWMSGDSVVFLRPSDRSATVRPRRHQPLPPRGGDAKVVGTSRYLGRSVLEVELMGPLGRGRRVWVDTSLPVVLKGEPIGPGHLHLPERQFLSIRPGVGCAPSAFSIPAGWTVRQESSRADSGGGRGRRHEASSLAEVVAAVGFEPPPPPWLPAGFAPRNWAWVDTREGPAAQILYSDGTRNLSLFWRAAQGPPPFCPADGCRDHKGAPVFFGQVGNLGLAVTGDLAPADLEHVAGVRK
jgi:hypothetical protein